MGGDGRSRRGELGQRPGLPPDGSLQPVCADDRGSGLQGWRRPDPDRTTFRRRFGPRSASGRAARRSGGRHRQCRVQIPGTRRRQRTRRPGRTSLRRRGGRTGLARTDRRRPHPVGSHCGRRGGRLDVVGGRQCRLQLSDRPKLRLRFRGVLPQRFRRRTPARRPRPSARSPHGTLGTRRDVHADAGLPRRRCTVPLARPGQPEPQPDRQRPGRLQGSADVHRL